MKKLSLKGKLVFIHSKSTDAFCVEGICVTLLVEKQRREAARVFAVMAAARCALCCRS